MSQIEIKLVETIVIMIIYILVYFGTKTLTERQKKDNSKSNSSF